MQYPKPVMSMRELEKMGFTKPWLLSVFNLRNCKVAWKSSPAANSKILFDTKGLEKIRIAQAGNGRGTKLLKFSA